MLVVRRSPPPPPPRRQPPGCAERCCRRRGELRPGDVFVVDRRASVQFSGDRRLLFRLTSIDQAMTYHGWVWLTGYALSPTGEALDRREIFVQLDGLQAVQPRASNTRPSRYA